MSKKREAYANKSRTGKGGSKSRRNGMLPTDRMTKQELAEYTKAGEVVISNMYETIIPKKEFDLKPKDLQKTMLMRWREIYPNSKIMKEMGISGNNAFSAMLNELDVPKKKRGGYRGRRNATPQSVPVSTPAKQTEEVITKLVTNGLHLEYNGNYDAKQIENILAKLQLLVSGEENKFRLSIVLSEIDG